MSDLRSKCPANVTLLRRKSSFVNGDVMVYIVRLLAAALASVMHLVQPILHLDTCFAHWQPQVLNACCKAGIWPLFIPALMTWFLQPLDTEGFAWYKFKLQRDHMDGRIRFGGDVDALDLLLECIYAATRDVLDVVNWAQAFGRAGFSAGQGELSLKRAQELKCGALAISCNRPTVDDLRLCFPRRTAVPVALLFKGVDQHIAPAGGEASLVPAIISDSFASDVAPPPISSRTRAKTKDTAAP